MKEGTMKRTILVLFLLTNITLVAQSKEFYPGSQYDPSVPTLEAVIGHDWGAEITSPADVERYILALAEKSSVVQASSFGTSWEGRKLSYLTISSEQNLGRLEQIQEGIQMVLPDALEAGVKLAIEPLHPMYAADRSAITTMTQANDMVKAIDSDSLGVAVDVFHLWWDPALENEIKRCGAMHKLFAFHVCDWNVPLEDMLNDRGLMGDGCIDLGQIRGWMEQAGFTGFHEVEVFSDKYWAMDQVDYLEKIKHAYLHYT
jgi:sugar phosphate isomerase/epimerase